MAALFGAVDLGASSGRVMAGIIDSGKLRLQELHRFQNGPVTEGDRLVWDFGNLFSNVLAGLERLAVFANEQKLLVESIGIDCWAVDYGLVAEGKLLQNPSCYRDPKNEQGVQRVHARVPFERLYASTGLQFLPFNSVYQLARQQLLEPHILDAAEHALLIPDLIGYFLTGKIATERTNASSTGLLSAKTLQWDEGIAQDLGIATSLFAPLARAGDVLGGILPTILPALSGTKIVLVGSHDTASAVVGIPSTIRGAAFLSSGTWSLLGAELDQPILTEKSRIANFTNELGVDDRVRYLKNLSGLWLVSESLRYFEEHGQPLELTELLKQASTIKPISYLAVSDPRFISPGDMPPKINQALIEAKQKPFESPADLIAIILHSLAASYATNFQTLIDLTGKSYPTLHIIGGGSQNTLLNQLTADYTKTQVIAGPVEATAIGNVLIQARSLGVVEGELEGLRQLIINSDFELRTFLPKE